MRKAGLEEAQAGNKTARRNISNLRYADDTILMAESEEELESLLMEVSLSELPEMVMNREAWRAVIHVVANSRTRLREWTELNWTESPSAVILEPKK